ncbi:MAG: GAF domain-containing sensor histidine kinase [Chloroflexi bacterium]|nr:GAF domain-containing sensor histidine kinase [Chloroflexota bacterium]
MDKKLHGTELLEYVIEASRRLAATRELKPLLSSILGEALKLMGAERGFIIFSKFGDEPDFKLRLDHTGKEWGEGKDEMSRSILNEVIHTSRSILLRDAMTNPRFSQITSVMNLQLRSIICVPFITRNHTIGAIYVENRSVRDRFQEEDLMTLKLFAKQAAVALENAALNRELKMATERERLKLQQEHLRLQNGILEKRAQDLAELNANKDKFFSIISHDLNSPFNILLTGAEILHENIDKLTKEEIRQMVYSIYSSAEKTFRLLQNLSTWARFQMDRMEYLPERLNLLTLVKECLVLLAESAAKKDIDLKFAIDPTLFVYADRHMLSFVIRNLVSNAIKFTDMGDQVTISACRKSAAGAQTTPQTAELIKVIVEDTGIGISDTNLEKLFRLDVHYTTEGTRKEKGTGLGLIICKEMVQRNKGSISVESEAGKGTKAHFTISAVDDIESE